MTYVSKCVHNLDTTFQLTQDIFYKITSDIWKKKKRPVTFLDKTSLHSLTRPVTFLDKTIEFIQDHEYFT